MRSPIKFLDSSSRSVTAGSSRSSEASADCLRQSRKKMGRAHAGPDALVDLGALEFLDQVRDLALLLSHLDPDDVPVRTARRGLRV